MVSHPNGSRKVRAALAAIRNTLASLQIALEAIEDATPDESSSDRLVDVAKYVDLPKRMVHGECRVGHIPNARKVHRRWMARPCDIEAWLSKQGREQEGPANDAADRVLARWAARKAAGGAAR